MTSSSKTPSFKTLIKSLQAPVVAAWAVHAFTASGAVLGFFTLYLLHLGDVIGAMWLMAAAVVVDAVDGTFARKARVSEMTPGFDGALLDNIIDYVNYVLAPAFLILMVGLVPNGFNGLIATAVLMASAYQFCCADAKTEDHYFKGFPSYWNIVVFYLYYLQSAEWINLLVITLLVVLSFVPIKYIYPSRLDHFSKSVVVRRLFLWATIAWGVATCGMLGTYPQTSPILIQFSVGYIVVYLCLSVYKTITTRASSNEFEEPSLDGAASSQ